MIGSLKEIDEDSFSTRLPADLVSDNARAAGSSSSVDWQMQQNVTVPAADGHWPPL